MRHQHWVRARAASGLVFSAFLGVHVVTALAGSLGQRAYDRLQHATQPVYHSTPFELVAIAGSLAVHVTSALVLLRERRARERAAGRPAGAVSPTLRWHRGAGYVLLVFVGGHAFATRVTSVLEGFPTGFEVVNHSLVSWPAWFYPYYALLLGAGIVHLVTGVRLACGTLGVKLPGLLRVRPRPSWGLALVPVLCLATVLGLGGHTAPVEHVHWARYRAYYERVLPVWLQTWR